MSNTFFGRMFIIIFSTLLPLILFITLFRFSSSNYHMFGFFDFANLLEKTAYLDLKKDVNAIIINLKGIQSNNDDLKSFIDLYDYFEETFNGFSKVARDNGAIMDNGFLSFAVNVFSNVMSVLSFISTSLIMGLGGILYLLKGISLLLSSINLVITLLTDFIPFAINLLSSFLLSFTSNVKDFFGEISFFGSSGFDSHMDWYESTFNS